MEPRTADADAVIVGGVGRRFAFVEVPQGSGDAAATVPLAVLTGARAGPTVWVSASLHGDEYLGPVTVARLLLDLDPADLRGTLIVTPALNMNAVRAMQRTDPASPVDFNRVWAVSPGSPTPPAVEWAASTILPRVDALIDLHSGGNRFLQHPFAAYPRTHGRVDEESLALAKACGVPWIWAHEGSILENALISAAARKGKPAVLLEIAGEGKAEPPWVEAMAAAVRGALARIGLVEAPPRLLGSYRVFDEFTILRNHSEGLWRRAVDPGASVHRGESLGHVLDFFAREAETVTSPADAAVAGICTYGYVPRQDYVAELLHSAHEEGPPA